MTYIIKTKKYSKAQNILKPIYVIIDLIKLCYLFAIIKIQITGRCTQFLYIHRRQCLFISLKVINNTFQSSQQSLIFLIRVIAENIKYIRHQSLKGTAAVLVGSSSCNELRRFSKSKRFVSTLYLSR